LVRLFFINCFLFRFLVHISGETVFFVDT